LRTLVEKALGVIAAEGTQVLLLLAGLDALGAITFDRYGKLMPRGEQEVGRLLGDCLDAVA
jgi:hypothetical protein